MKHFILLIGVVFTQFGMAQERDTIKVMSYNLLKFPSVSPNRIDTLKTIVGYFKPDIFMVCELTSGAGADDILFNALNEDGESDYDMADYVPSPDTENELYFNSTKLGLIEQNVIETDLRNINEYVLYYKSIDIETTIDTTFFYVYVCHLKASQGFEDQRNTEITALKNYLATRTKAENIIVGGDFNFYGSDTEPAWNTLLNEGGVIIKDPLTLPGHWHTDPGFAYIHTQSTRTESFDGGADGGMDDRFDFIFIGDDLKTYANDAIFIPGSYRAIGQDGLRYNQSLIDPVNTTEPPHIISSLYYMSDHLPIYLEIEVVKIGASIESISPVDVGLFFDPIHDRLAFSKNVASLNLGKNDKYLIYNLSGQLMHSEDSLLSNQYISTTSLESGAYLLKISNSDSFVFKFVKP